MADGGTTESGLGQRTSGGPTDRISVLEAVLEERNRHYMQMFTSQAAAMEQAIDAAKGAIDKADAATERRFESVNEFRAQLNDMVNRLMPRSEADQQSTALGARIDSLKEHVLLLQTQVTTMQAKGQGVAAGWGYLVGAIGVIGAVATLVAYWTK